MELSKKFEDELLNCSLDLGTDYAEIFIDEISENEILKEIPIVKTIVSANKIVGYIRENFAIKKFLVFLATFNKGLIDEDNLLDFRNKIKEDKKYRDKVIERTLVIIDRLEDVKKAEILSRLFVKYVIPHCVRICAKRDKKRASRVRFTSTKTKPKCLPSTSARPTLST